VKPAEESYAHARNPAWPIWTSGYLTYLAGTGQKTAAAEFIKKSPTTVMNCRRNHPDFLEAENAAMQEARAVMESEAVRRAVQGDVEETFDPKTGALVRRKTVYSDTIMLRLLERMETGSWRQKQQIEMGGPGSFPTAAERRTKLDEARKAREKAVNLNSAPPAIEIEAVSISPIPAQLPDSQWKAD
jgi:hypothetical protein